MLNLILLEALTASIASEAVIRFQRVYNALIWNWIQANALQILNNWRQVFGLTLHAIVFGLPLHSIVTQ